MGEGVAGRIRRFPVQTPQGARPGLWTQQHYEALSDLRLKIVENA